MTREEATICRIFLEDVAEKYKNCNEYKLLMNAINTIPCEDAVSRQAVLNTLDDMDKALDVYRTVGNYKALLKECFENLTPVQPKAKTKTGHWIMPVQDDGTSDPIYYQVRCSKCGFDLDPQTWDIELHQRGADKCCPNCGAKMESEGKE